jgi:hypothetical protein
MPSTAARKAVTAIAVASWLPRYVAYAALRRVFPLASVARWAWSPARTGRDPAREARMIACVHRLRQFLAPRGGDCLPASLVFYHAFSRRGASPTLNVGFRRADRGLDGHAWVVVDGECVDDTADNLAGFVVAFSFDRDGQLSSAPDAR